MEVSLDGLVTDDELEEICFGRVMTPTEPIDPLVLETLLAHTRPVVRRR